MAITKIAIAGCCGRMGKSIASLALKDEMFRIAGVCEAKDHPDIGHDLGELIGEGSLGITVSEDLAQAAKDCDVIIDFTKPSATVLNLGIAKKLNLPIVIGTTGLTDEEFKVMRSVSTAVPVLYSSNMSVGVNVLFRVAPEVARSLGDGYDIEIVEVHHNKKKDSPSGTAKTLAEQIAQAKGRKLSDIVVYGREGDVGERKKGEIGIHAVRAGDVIGDHTVIFAGDNERIEITHRAHSRDVLAKGALRAAKFLAERSPGLYNMQNVLEGV